MAAPKPLLGRRILVTRPRDQAAEFVRRLEELGAEPCVLPVIAIEPPQDWNDVASRIDRIAEFDWLVFTSANGVRMLFDWMIDSNRGLDGIWQVKVAAIGPATADELRRYGIELSLMAADHRSEGLAAAMAESARNASVLLARAECGRELLVGELARFCRVEAIAVYRQRVALDRADPVFERMRHGEIDVVTLTSGNIARAFLRSLDDASANRLRDGSIQIASISPITSGVIRELGFAVHVEASEQTTEGLIAALMDSPRET